MEAQLPHIQNRNSKAFFEAFIITLTICLLPLKGIAFVVPFISIGWFLIRSRSGRSFKKLYVLCALWIILLVFHKWFNALLGENFVFANGLLSFITYSSLIALAFPSAITSNKHNYTKYAGLLLGLILIEGSLGILQRMLAPIFLGDKSSGGDVVEGTINPLSFLNGHSGFSNQFFVISLICFILFCFPFALKHKKKILPIAIGFVAIILASVGHVFISLLIAMIVTFLIFEGAALIAKPKVFLAFTFLLVCMLAVFAVLDGGVFKNTSRQFEMFVDGNTPKSKALIKAFSDLGTHQPSMHLVGVGPGNYSSRAGTIASGTYGQLSTLFTSIPYLEIRMSDNFKNYVLDDWLYMSNNTNAFGNSTMYRPFFSLLSLYTEFGGLAFFLLLVFLFYHIFKLKRYYILLKKDPSKKEAQQLAFCCAVMILLLVFIGLYENYYETPQGIFPGILLILVISSILRDESKGSASSNSSVSRQTAKTNDVVTA